MPFTLLFTDQANADLDELESNKALQKRAKAAKKTTQNPPHIITLATTQKQFISTTVPYPISATESHVVSSSTFLPATKEYFAPAAKTTILSNKGNLNFTNMCYA